MIKVNNNNIKGMLMQIGGYVINVIINRANAFKVPSIYDVRLLYFPIQINGCNL